MITHFKKRRFTYNMARFYGASRVTAYRLAFLDDVASVTLMFRPLIKRDPIHRTENIA